MIFHNIFALKTCDIFRIRINKSNWPQIHREVLVLSKKNHKKSYFWTSTVYSRHHVQYIINPIVEYNFLENFMKNVVIGKSGHLYINCFLFENEKCLILEIQWNILSIFKLKTFTKKKSVRKIKLLLLKFWNK